MCERDKAELARFPAERCAAEIAEGARIVCRGKDDATAVGVLLRRCKGDARGAAICEQAKSDAAEMQRRCPDTASAAAKVVCRSADDGMAVARLMAQCAGKITANLASGKIESFCKAVDPADGKDIAEASGAGSIECGKVLKQKFMAARCAPGVSRVAYVHKNGGVGNQWSNGVKLTLACN
jgi:hypothetical protein